MLSRFLFAHTRRRMNGVPIEKGPATTRRFPLTLEPNRANVSRGDNFARQCGPVGDSKNDEERGDALFVTSLDQNIRGSKWVGGAENRYEPESQGRFER